MSSHETSAVNPRIARYASLATATAATVTATTDAAVVNSDPAWKATISVQSAGTGGFISSSVSAFGPGATLLNGKFFASVIAWRSVGSRSGVIGVQPNSTAAVRGTSLNIGDVVSGLPTTAWGYNVTGFNSDWATTRYTADTTFPINLGTGTGASSVRGYYAFRFSDGLADYHYGYFDIEFSRSGTDVNSSISLTIHGWAYEDVAGQPITVAAAVPGGAGLAALALGASGCRARRRSRC
ncbi:MAG: hypothetical protein ACO3QA_12715 [Phycisphaerales bacterium]